MVAPRRMVAPELVAVVLEVNSEEPRSSALGPLALAGEATAMSMPLTVCAVPTETLRTACTGAVTLPLPLLPTGLVLGFGAGANGPLEPPHPANSNSARDATIPALWTFVLSKGIHLWALSN